MTIPLPWTRFSVFKIKDSQKSKEKKYEDEPIFIKVVERKKDVEEAENWTDNFQVTEVHKIDRAV